MLAIRYIVGRMTSLQDGKWMSWLDILSDLGEARAALSIARSRYAHLGWEWKIMEVREIGDG